MRKQAKYSLVLAVGAAAAGLVSGLALPLIKFKPPKPPQGG